MNIAETFVLCTVRVAPIGSGRGRDFQPRGKVMKSVKTVPVSAVPQFEVEVKAQLGAFV